MGASADRPCRLHVDCISDACDLHRFGPVIHKTAVLHFVVQCADLVRVEIGLFSVNTRRRHDKSRERPHLGLNEQTTIIVGTVSRAVRNDTGHCG